MPKRKKRGVQKKRKDDSPSDLSEGESIDRLPSSKKVAAASSTSHLEDEVDQISSFTSISLLNSSKSESGEIAALSSSHFFCNYCEFSAETKPVLLAHMRQHMIKCPHCSFSSLSRIEVSRHCKHEHEEDPEGVSQEVDSSSADCEMDKDPCTACVFCSFMTYSTEHLEKHTIHKHPGMLAKSVARMITKQNSTEVRRDDALFYLSIPNEGLSKSSGYNLIASEKSSSPIVIDPIVNKTEDVKPEVKLTCYTKSSSYSSEQTGQLKEQTYSDNRMATNTGEKTINRSTKGKTEGSSGIPMQVKVETLYCLTCPYSNVYIEKLKCHTVVQHPVGAAVATYNSTGVDAEDITFFCVSEDCSHSSSDCTSYQKHLMSCYSYQKTMKVLEKERLKSTITYILEHQRKYKLPAADGFFDFASPFLDVCLPPTLTGISSSAAAVEAQSFHHRRAERSLNATHRPAVNAVQTSVESSPLPTGLYKTPSRLSSTAVSSSGSPSNESMSSNGSQLFFPQQVQNIHSTANSTGDYQSQMLHNPVILPVQADSFSRNMPTDGRSMQPVQGHSVSLYPHSQGNYPQPSSANSLVASYPDTPQATVSWPTGQVQAANLPSVPVQSEQNYSNAFPTQNLDVNATGLRMQNGGAFNPLSLSRSDSFSVGHNGDMNQNFIPAASHNYAPSPGQVSQAPGSNLHINLNSSFPGQSSETSANSVSNVMISSDAMTVSNSMTGNVFYGQQNPVSNVLNTSNVDQCSIETQPQAKMVDLLSDSYSILLSDEFGPDGQIQQVTDNNSFIQTPVCPPSYQPEATLSTQNQAVVLQLPLTATPQGQPVPYQPMQHEGSRFQQMVVDNSQLPDCGNQFSFPVANQNNQMTSMASSLGPNSSFQTAQNSSNGGALQRALSTEESSGNQPAPFRSSEVPNFLVSPGTPSSEMVPHSAPSFNHRHPSTGQPAVGHPGTFTPPKNSNPGNKFASASPLSPSIYLSGQVPRHRRSNWTDADMSPRGMMLPGMSSRHVHPPVPAAGSHSYMSQRHSVPARRGYSRGPRMSAGRGRMPIPRMPGNQVGGGGGDDDDVILTAVIRGTPPKNQPPHQPPGGRAAYRGVPNPAPRGRGQVLPVQNRQRSQNSSPRVPYPVAPPPALTHKQFDISKHFEDLACVVNASAEEGGDDIQIVAVTPGKDKDKVGQSKAVDASKFSFCCVHCGKDQGSKTVMKLHMKARHNDSLLGAFTNTETSQLLFFCPQLTCEFMTYDEKRLSEHLSKCFDLDRSKPFDFGTAIKNLKSLKIRQLDVRTMGRSQDCPIDLDGQGMKDNFSSSLNDAFGDIVVNASGRHMLRNATLHQTRLPQPQSAPAQSGTMQNKAPVRSLPPSNIATRLGHPRLPQQGNVGNRMLRPMAPFHYTKQQSYEMRPHLRQTGPANMPMDARNIRDMRPRAPVSAAHCQPMQMRAAPPPNVTTPRMPNRGQQDPVVIVIDVDSPERPEEGQQIESMITESPEVINQLPVVSSIQSSSSDLLSVSSAGCPESTNASPYREQQTMSDNPYLLPGHSALASPDFNPGSRLSHDDSALRRTQASQLSSLIDRPVSYSYDRSHTPDEAPESDEDPLQQNSATLSGTISTHSHLAALSSSQQDEPDSEYIPERSAADLDASVSDRVMGKSTPRSTEFVPASAYAPIESSDVKSQISEHATNSSHGAPTCTSSSSSVTTIPPASSYSNMEPAGEYFDEEEKVNALVLEKVFAKVPNMPKNLSRRLVAKFKEYAKHRGVKITTDSKVIDEFVSKIYYKGSAGDKAASRPQQTPDASQFQPVGPQQASQFDPDRPPQASQFDPDRPQQASQFQPVVSQQASQFDPVGSQQASQFEPDGPPQASQFQHVGSQQASQFEPDGSQQASQFEPDGPQQASQFQPVGSQQASQFDPDESPQASQFEPAGSQQASQFDPDGPPQASQFQRAGTPHVATSTPLSSAVSSSPVPSSENIQPTHSEGDYESSHREGDYDSSHRESDYDSSQREGDYDSSQREGDYDSSQREGDYDSSQREGDYDSSQREGDYDSSQREGDYDSSQREGDYDSSQREGDYDSSQREGDYDSSQREGDYDSSQREGDYDSSQEYHDHNTDMVQTDLQQKEHPQEELMAVADPSFSEQASANEVVATHVILAERTLHFSPTFASIARKSSAMSAQMLANVHNQDVGQKKVEANQDAHSEFSGSMLKSAVNTDSTTVLNRRNSLNDGVPSRPAANLRRSGSLSQIVTSVTGSSGATTTSPEHVHEDLKLEASSSPMNISDVIGSPENTSVLDPREDCGEDAFEPAAETVQEQNLPVIYHDQFKEEVEVSFPPVSESETAPILITSSVADIVSGHPGLEVDIAGKPLKQELLDEDNRDMNDVEENEDKDFSKSLKDQVLSPKDMFEKVTPKSSNMIDRTTGKLLLKKKKRGRPRKLFTEKEEKREEESKNLEAEEERIVRRSSRSRKPVNKDYRSDVNEIDELMSDDDDEYLIDEEDYDTDTDGDWRRRDSEQPPKKRIKKVVPPPDPTAFDISTKGKFKCWQCKKVFSRCTFAKSHIIQKHKEGLCAVYMDKSEESKTPSLLVFCPRKCRYVTFSIEGLVNHVENCAETELEADGKPYLDINKAFLDNKYKELQGMSLEAVLSIPKTRKAKDPTKPTKVKKSLSINKSTAAAPVIIHHSDALVIIDADNVVASTVAASSLSGSAPVVASPIAPQTTTSHRSSLSGSAPMVASSVAMQTATSHRSSLSGSAPMVASPVALQAATSHRSCLSGSAPMVALPVALQAATSRRSSLSGSAPMVASPVALQTATSHRSNIGAHGQTHLQPAVRSPTATDYNTSMASKQHFFLPHKATQHNSPQVSGQYPSPVAMDMANPHFHQNTGNTVSSAGPAAYKHPPGQHMFSTSEQVKANSSFPQPALPRVSSTNVSTDQEDDIVYMIEDNGTICLK